MWDFLTDLDGLGQGSDLLPNSCTGKAMDRQLRRVASRAISASWQSSRQAAVSQAGASVRFVQLAAEQAVDDLRAARSNKQAVPNVTPDHDAEGRVKLPEGFEKLTTGITGVDVIPHSRKVFIEECAKVLTLIQLVPAGVYYRELIEATYKFRMELAEGKATGVEVEEALGLGLQMEELIQHARDEQELIPKYAEWRPWEQVDAEPEIDDCEELFHGAELSSHPVHLEQVKAMLKADDSVFSPYTTADEAREKADLLQKLKEEQQKLADK